jgi:ankyrin repeat protein
MNHQEILFQAIRNEDAIVVKKLLQEDPSLLNIKDNRGSTPLLLATYFGNEEITDFLLSLKPDIDEKDASGNTALMGVCFKGFGSIAEKLIKAGANVNETNYSGATALVFAATFNRIDLVKLLLKNGANPDLKDIHGNTAASQARMQGLKGIAELLES